MAVPNNWEQTKRALREIEFLIQESARRNAPVGETGNLKRELEGVAQFVNNQRDIEFAVESVEYVVYSERYNDNWFERTAEDIEDEIANILEVAIAEDLMIHAEQQFEDI